MAETQMRKSMAKMVRKMRMMMMIMKRMERTIFPVLWWSIIPVSALSVLQKRAKGTCKISPTKNI
jgi:hypothetical protein